MKEFNKILNYDDKPENKSNMMVEALNDCKESGSLKFNQIGQDRRIRSVISGLLVEKFRERKKSQISGHDVVSSIKELKSVKRKASVFGSPFMFGNAVSGVNTETGSRTKFSLTGLRNSVRVGGGLDNEKKGSFTNLNSNTPEKAKGYIISKKSNKENEKKRLFSKIEEPLKFSNPLLKRKTKLSILLNLPDDDVIDSITSEFNQDLLNSQFSNKLKHGKNYSNSNFIEEDDNINSVQSEVPLISKSFDLLNSLNERSRCRYTRSKIKDSNKPISLIESAIYLEALSNINNRSRSKMTEMKLFDNDVKKPSLISTIPDTKCKVSEANEYYKNIKSSIESYEDPLQFSKNNLLLMDKETLKEKYMKGQVITSSKNSINNISNENILNKSTGPKKEKKRNSSKISEKRKSIERTKEVKEHNRNLSKRKKVEDSMSDDSDEANILIHQPSFFTINPQSDFIKYWDYLIILITFYFFIVIPYYLAFIDVDEFSVVILEIIFDLLFIIDIAISFFVGFFNFDEELVMNLYLIAINYLTGWFILDTFASIPGSLIMFILNNSNNNLDSSLSKKMTYLNKTTRLTRFYKIIKFLKLFKILKISKDKQKNVQLLGLDELNLTSAKQRFINFIVSFLLISHMLTCLWIYIGKSNEPNWLTKANLIDASTPELYIASLYFHWVTIFTIGYGDITSINSVERVYNSLLMFFGILIYSFAVSSMGTIISSYDNITARYYKNAETLEDMRVNYKLPALIYQKLTKFLKYDLKFNKNEKYSFINDIPANMRNELLNDMYKDIIKSFKFFADCKKEFISRVVFCMRPLRAYKKDDLVVEGDHINEVYFVRRGILSVHLGPKYGEPKIMEVRKNEHFGDVLIISKIKSPVTIKVASTIADLLIIRKQDFSEISKEYPEEFEDSTILSAYNYMVMLELIQKKKADLLIDKIALSSGNSKNSVTSLRSDKASTILSNNPQIFNVFNDQEVESNINLIKMTNHKDEFKRNSFESSVFRKDDKNGINLKAKSDANRFTHNNFSEKIIIDFIPSLNKEVEVLDTPPEKTESNLIQNAADMYNFNFIIQNNNFINNPESNNELNWSCKSKMIIKEITNYKNEEKVTDSIPMASRKSDKTINFKNKIIGELFENGNNKTKIIERENIHKPEGNGIIKDNNSHSSISHIFNNGNEKDNQAFINPELFFIREFKSWIISEYKNKNDIHILKLQNFITKVAKINNLNEIL